MPDQSSLTVVAGRSWRLLLMALAGTFLILTVFVIDLPGPAQADTVVSDCTGSAPIQSALSQGGVVTFACPANSQTITITQMLVVTRSVTLNGGSLVTLNGAGVRIINVANGTAMTLTNVTLKNGTNPDGLGGGAVRVGISGTLISVNGVFTNNRALGGSSPLGGAIFGDVGSTLIVRNSSILSNSAIGGGGIYALATISVTDSTFVGNSGGFFGGGLFAVNDANIANSTFISNTSNGGGGAFFNSTATITGSTFTRNRAGPIGGGLVAITDVNIINSTFVSNTANVGGGTYLSTTGRITGATYVSNTAIQNGGGVAASVSADIVSSMFMSNTAGTNGGGVHAPTAAVTGSTIVDNIAGSNGGGISGQLVTIGNSTIVNNKASGGGGVFAAFNVASRVSITNSTISSNWASQLGGGIYASFASVAGSAIVSNTAGSHGGGISANVAIVLSSTIQSNAASQVNALSSGGGVSAQAGATIIGSSIVSNTAGSSGGGVSASTATVESSTLSGNRTITQAGGAISAPSVRLTNATIVGNTAPPGAGAILFSASLVMTNTTVVANGHIAISGTTTSAPFTMTDSIVGGPGSPLCSHKGTLLGKNLVQDLECVANVPAGNHILDSPQLGPLQENGGATKTMAPLGTSQAIGGSPVCQVVADQRGASRNTPCDLGAYETGVSPVLTSLNPATAPAGGAAMTITATGSGFVLGTTILWNGSARPTTIVDLATLKVAVPASDLISAGVATIQARYGLAADSVSNGLSFTIAGTTPTPPPAPGPPPSVSSVAPISGTTNALTNLTIVGLNFRTGATVRLENPSTSQPLLNPSVAGSTTIFAEVPAGIPAGIYDVVVTNADGTTGRLKAAFTVFGQSPLPVRIVPERGDRAVPNDLQIDGFNFRDGVSIEIQKDGTGTFQPLAYQNRQNATRIKAVVPVALPSGVYDLVVRNAGVQEVGRIPRAYTVFAAGEEDLIVGSEDLWIDPPTVRQGSTVRAGLTIHRPFGTSFSQIPVRFYLGNPDAGGQLVGEATSATLAPPATSISVSVSFVVPNAPGEVDLYAVVDQANSIAEIAKTNNRASRSVRILPANPTAVAPTITSLTIAGGAQATSSPFVGIQVQAASSVEGASLGYLLINEREFNSSALEWVAIASTGWIQYTGFLTIGLTDRSGTRFLEAYVADTLGTISLSASRSQIDFVPSGDALLQGQRRVYRRGVKPGDEIAFSVDPSSGDPDVNLFDAANNLVFGTNQIGGIREDGTFPVTVGGLYQIEFSAATDTVFGFTIRSGAPNTTLILRDPLVALDQRPAPVRPILPVSSGPHDRTGLPMLPLAFQPTVGGKIVHLPAAARGFPGGW